MLSDTVNAQSRLLDHRTPRERVERVAPWLTLDGNAYPAVVAGPGAVDPRRLHDLQPTTRTRGCSRSASRRPTR